MKIGGIQMPTSIWRAWLLWAILVIGLAGCQGMSSPKGPQDPLFLSKVPINAKAELAAPVTFAYLEPAMPKDPFERLNAPALADQSEGRVPATLTNRPKDPQ
jgi:hypothetical protein